MPSIKRILSATDFSDSSDRALQFATFLARGFAAKLDVVHVMELHPGMNQKSPVAKIYLKQLGKEANQKFSRLNKESKIDISAYYQLVGTPSDQINKLASECGADLVVVGTHGWTGINHVLLGSTAERVVRGVPCPVATVRRRRIPGSDRIPSHTRYPIAKLNRILVPIDFSSCSLKALDYAVEFSNSFNASLLLLHVMEPPHGSDFIFKGKVSKDRIKEKLRELISSARPGTDHSIYVVGDNSPSEVILDRTNENSPDLIIMGTHGRRGFSHLVNGSVAEAVLRKAVCPVVTVKQPKI